MKRLLTIAGITGLAGVSSVMAVSDVSAANNPTNNPLADTSKSKPALIGNEERAKNTGTTNPSASKGAPAMSDDGVEVSQGRRAFLSQAVSQGKITRSQADQLMAKMDELMPRNLKAGFESKTIEERKAIMEAKVNAFNQWARDQHIPSDILPVVAYHDTADGKNVLSIEEKS